MYIAKTSSQYFLGKDDIGNKCQRGSGQETMKCCHVFPDLNTHSPLFAS